MPRRIETEADAERVRAHRRKWYAQNGTHSRAKTREYHKKLKEWYVSYKEGLSCIKCGESHPGCLDFHHRDGSQKEFSICMGVTRRMSKERILKEIAKCDVLCRNCHAKLHWEIRFEASKSKEQNSKQLKLF